MDSKAIYKFFTIQNSDVTFTPFSAMAKIPKLFNRTNFSTIGGKNNFAGILVSAILVAGILYLIVNLIKYRKKSLLNNNLAYYILASWLGFGLLGLGFYNQEIYDHYLGFLFPIPFILVGLIISKLTSWKLQAKIFGVLILLYLVVINLLNNPFKYQPNRLMQRSIDVANIIEQNSNKEPFNLAVIADTNYEDGYKYFLLKDNYPVVDIDALVPSTITKQLFVVCELIPNSKCDPTHSPKTEVANFGWSKIENNWEVDGTIVYKLVHSI